MPETEIIVKVKTAEDETADKLVKVDKGRLIDLDKGAFPQLHLQGSELPFTEEDVGKEVPITGMVKLTSIKYQGYNYIFEMTKLDFPGRDIDKGTAKARKQKKAKRERGK